MPLVIVFTMLDPIVANIPSHGNEYEKARAAAYMTWDGRCTLFGNIRSVRAVIVSSNYSPMCRTARLSHTLLCFQRSQSLAI